MVNCKCKDGTTEAWMWRCHDTPAETVGVLWREVRNMDVWTEQALSSDGETTQSRARGCRTGLCETGSQSRRGIYVPWACSRSECHYRNFRYGAESLQGLDQGAVAWCGICQARAAFCRGGLYGTPALLHYRQVRHLVCAPVSPEKQLACQESCPLRQLQHDERRWNLRTHYRHRTASSQICRYLHHTGAVGASPWPRSGAPLQPCRSRGAGRYGHHPLHRRLHRSCQRVAHFEQGVGWGIRDVWAHRKRRDFCRTRPVGHPYCLLVSGWRNSGACQWTSRDTDSP